MNRAALGPRLRRLLWRGAQNLMAVLGAVGLTFGFFLILPLLQEMGRSPERTMEVRQVDTAVLEPPPPPEVEDEEEPEEAEEPPPTELTEQSPPPMDLSQLEMALDFGMGDGMGGAGSLAVGRLTGSDADRDEETAGIFSMADLDQRPRVVSQPPPRYPAELRGRKLRGTVYILFIVDQDGRVVKPKVQKSTHSAFERPALEAVRSWKFEPGKRGGTPVRFRMRVPITFAAG